MNTINIIIYIYFLINIVVVTSLYLNKIQQDTITNLIKENKLSLGEREKINTILFEAYQDCAHKRAVYFKYIHRYKCRNIAVADLKSASEVGLMKATIDYNGNSSFFYYSSLHIKNELLNLLTNHNAFSPISKTTLRKGFSSTKKKFNITDYYLLQNKLNVVYESIKSPKFLQLVTSSQSNPLENIIEEEERDRIWQNVLSLIEKPLMKKIFILRYDKDYKKIRTTEEISKLLNYSKGHIINNLSKIKVLLKDNLINMTDSMVTDSMVTDSVVSDDMMIDR
jgi:RNA polymerase sigma factor (sigma-70 family)